MQITFAAHILTPFNDGHLMRQGMQDLNKAAPQAAGGEADAETQQAVQRVFNLVRNGASSNGNGAKDCDLTLDDVVRFYNVSCGSILCPSLLAQWPTFTPPFCALRLALQ
jgi:hypothetical protein